MSLPGAEGEGRVVDPHPDSNPNQRRYSEPILPTHRTKQNHLIIGRRRHPYVIRRLAVSHTTVEAVLETQPSTTLRVWSSSCDIGSRVVVKQ